MKWIIRCNPQVYDIDRAYQIGKTLYWPPDARFHIGDEAYFYISTEKAVRYKCSIKDPSVTVTDTSRSESQGKVKYRYLAEMDFLIRYSGDDLSFENLRKHGLNFNIIGPMRITGQLESYFERVDRQTIQQESQKAPVKEPNQRPEEKTEQTNLKRIKLNTAGLSDRIVNALKRYGVRNAADLIELNEDDLFVIGNLNRKDIDEIRKAIQKYSAVKASSPGPQVSEEKKAVPAAAPIRPLSGTRPVQNRMRLEKTGLSERTLNVLKRYRVETVEQLLEMKEEDFLVIGDLGRKAMDEIRAVQKKYAGQTVNKQKTDREENASADHILTILTENQRPDSSDPQKQTASALLAGQEEAVIDPNENFESWLEQKDNRELVLKYFEQAQIRINCLDLLSVKAFNTLRFAGIRNLSEILFKTDDELTKIPKLTDSIANEIISVCLYYLKKNKRSILEGIKPFEAEKKAPSPEPAPVPDEQPEPNNEEIYKKIEQYVRMHDVALTKMGISDRLIRTMYGYGYYKLSDIMFVNKEDLLRIQGIKEQEVESLLDTLKNYLKVHQSRIKAYCEGDESVLIDEEAIHNHILDIFRDMGFSGLHYQDIVDRMDLPNDIEDSTIKKVIGRMIADQELEYIDFMVYRLYPTFDSYLEKCRMADRRAIRWIGRKLDGMSWEELEASESVIQTKMQEIIDNTIQLIREQYLAETGMAVFNEDYYKYFFTTFRVDKSTCTEWLGIPEKTFNYLELFYTAGRKNIEEAPEDNSLETGLRIKINSYLNRDKLFIDGYWIENDPEIVENYVLARECLEPINYDRFVEQYNGFLIRYNVPFETGLYILDDMEEEHRKRLFASRNVVLVGGTFFRYYDIDGQDYTELLDYLSLDSYRNIQISTNRFIRNNPWLMNRYGIQNEYELHNLLLKIIPEGSYNDFHCEKPPMIRFGKADLAEEIREIVINNAPITKAKLVDLLQREMGYDTVFINQVLLKHVKAYLFKGVYRADYKVMPEYRRKKLAENLPEDFYYLDDVKRIYSKLYEDADPEEINSYNMKKIGFEFYSNCVLKNHESLSEFFKEMLLAQDITDISEMRKKYRNVQTWVQVMLALKKDYEIVEFEPDQIITYRKLSSNGIDKTAIRRFCADVYDCMEDGEYFSAKKLKDSGFYTELYEYGFSDLFYANLLCNDDRFSYGNIFSNIILCKTRSSITTQSFLLDQIERAGSVDIYDLMDDINELYGCEIKDKKEILTRIKNTDVYYETIMERLYANADLFYNELDDDSEDLF